MAYRVAVEYFEFVRSEIAERVVWAVRVQKSDVVGYGDGQVVNLRTPGGTALTPAGGEVLSLQVLDFPRPELALRASLSAGSAGALCRL